MFGKIEPSQGRDRVARVQQPPRIARHRRRIARHIDDAIGAVLGNRLHRLARNSGARRIDNDRLRTLAASLDVVFNGAYDGSDHARVRGGILAEVPPAVSIALDCRDPLMAGRRQRD